jgi:RNA polymerase sigma-70 factor (ECF subfamily)
VVQATGRSTRVSILIALRNDPGDQSAWSAFVDRYGPQIHAWCLRWKLQDADAQDVTQMVLLKLVRHLPDFTYDPSRSFRGWLRTLTAHSWSDFIGDQVRGVRGAADTAVADLLNTAQARVDLVCHLEETYDQEMLELAMAEVSQRVEPHTWEAFRQTAIEGVAAAEVAVQLGTGEEAPR